MKRYKGLVCIALSLIMVLSIAACSGGESSTASQEPAGSTESTAAEPSADSPAEPAAEPSGDAVTITFWDMVVGGDQYPALAEELTKKITDDLPNITIEYQSIPWANRYETFTTAIASGEAPDMSTGGGYQSFQFAGAGEILDIGSIVTEWEADGTLANYKTDLIEYFQYDGMQVGIPWNYEPRYIIYRSDWFEEAGIAAPKTWDDLYDAAVHFTDSAAGVYGFTYATSGSSGNVLFNTWLSTNGSGIWQEDGQHLDWTNEKNVESINFIRKMRDAGVFPEGMAAYEGNEVTQLCLQDSAAIAIITGGNQAALFAEAGVQDKWAIMEAPAGPSANGNQGYVAAINAIMAYSQTKHPEETKQALKWWCENMYQMWHNKDAQVSGIPVRNDWLDDPTYRETMSDPFMASFIDNSIDTTHSLIYPATNINGWLSQNTFDGERWWSALSQAILTDTASPEELLQDVQDRANQVMKDFDEYVD